jgi:hypothetical protein
LNDSLVSFPLALRLRLAMRAARISILVCCSAAFPCHAQILAPADISIERLRTECITIETYPVPIAQGECTVVDSGRLTVVDGFVFYFARYRITAPVPSWPELRDIVPDANALILFDGPESGESVRVYRSYHENPAEFDLRSFPVPEVLATSRGQVLHIRQRAPGDGMFQWFKDEYWIWRLNEWQKLDVTSWYAKLDAYVPATYSVAGVSSDHFDLIGLRNVSPVRRASDADCCPSGGIVTVSFRWVDDMLTIRDVSYDPDTDFRSP